MQKIGRHTLPAAVLCLLIILFSTAGVYGSSIITPPSGKAKLSSLQDLENLLSRLSAEGKNTIVEEIGKSGKRSLPIHLVTIENQADSSHKIKVMIIARVHGNEPAGMEAAMHFMESLAIGEKGRESQILDDFIFYIIPCLNPEGTQTALQQHADTGGFWNRNGRGNAANIDINRDYLSLQSAESKICVRTFNRISPHVVFDLHEYSTIPLITGGDGWWRGKYFDLMMGAGRHPDVYPPMSLYARNLCEEVLFPRMKQKNLSAGYYALSGGNIDSTGNRGSTGADYFNIRNAVTFLIETPGADLGEEKLEKRIQTQLTTLEIILSQLKDDKSRIFNLIKEASEWAAERETIVQNWGYKPITVEVAGRKSAFHSFSTKIIIDKKEFHSKAKVQFRDRDPEKDVPLDMPGGYVIMGGDSAFIEKLMLHGIQVYEALDTIDSGGTLLPRHSFYVPQDQVSSAIIGLILDERIADSHNFAPRARMIIMPVELSLNLSNFKKIGNQGEIFGAMKRFSEYMEALLKKDAVEDNMETE